MPPKLEKVSTVLALEASKKLIKYVKIIYTF